MLCNSNNFQHIEKMQRASLNNSVSKILLKYQFDRIKIVRVRLLAELKNAVLKKTRLIFQNLPTCYQRRLTRKSITLKIKYFWIAALLHFYYEFLK